LARKKSIKKSNAEQADENDALFAQASYIMSNPDEFLVEAPSQAVLA